MRKNHKDMCQAFDARKEAHGDKVPKTGQYRWTVTQEKDSTILYSYNLPIARMFPNGQIKLLRTKVSKTTTMQINAVKEYYMYDSARVIETTDPIL